MLINVSTSLKPYFTINDKIMKKKKTLYLIDGTAYVYRAYHAIRFLTNSKGFSTNAVFGFTRMLLKFLEDKKAEYVIMFFDVKGPTFRHEMYDEYKANRPPMPDDLSAQIPYIKKITKAYNIQIIEKAGYEADDLIGSFAKKAEKEGFFVTIVTGDKDFVQLVTENIIILDTMKDKITDKDTVQSEYGGLLPKHITDIMGLSGDTADNVPGVPGIGIKTAISLIKTYDSIDNIYENIDKVTGKKRRENLEKYKDQAYLSKKLVTIVKDVSFETDLLSCKPGEPDNEKLFELFDELEFKNLQQTVLKTTDLSKKEYKGIFNKEDLNDLVKYLKSAEIISIDTETTSKNPVLAEIVGISVAVKENEAFYIPFGHDYEKSPAQLLKEDVLDSLRPVIEDDKIKKVGQNIKYDMMVFSKCGIEMKGTFFDTMVASYLINPSARGHSLDKIAMNFLNHKTILYSDVAGTGKKEICFSKVDVNTAVTYACEDADICLMVYKILSEQIKEHLMDDLLNKVEMPLVSVLSRMELNGISIDKTSLKKLSVDFSEEISDIEKSIYKLAEEEFNIKSSQQLSYILFEKLKLPVSKKTKKKTGYSTDIDVLTKLAPQHELPEKVLRYRTLVKLKTTYVDSLLNMMNHKTGRIHTSYNQTVTVTGRLSSSKPNLQNIPSKGVDGIKIRSAFIPESGWKLVAFDYSQIELRILAHCSNDKILVESFKNDEDVHLRTASEIFNVLPTFLTKELRAQAKTINFGIIYGMSSYGLSKTLGISRKMAKNYIENYFLRYKGVKNYIDKIVEEVKKTKKVNTLLGRVRYLYDIDSKNKNVREFAERAAVNTIIQGTAADLIKLAMIKVDAYINQNRLKTAMLLTVHDELVFEIPDNEFEKTVSVIKDIMEGIWKLCVPLKVNMGFGDNWTEAH